VARKRNIKPVVAPPLDARAIGQRIARNRRWRKWTQGQLAQATGVSRDTIVGYENGLRVPRRDTLVLLSVALRRRIDWLLFDKRVVWK